MPRLIKIEKPPATEISDVHESSAGADFDSKVTKTLETTETRDEKRNYSDPKEDFLDEGAGSNDGRSAAESSNIASYTNYSSDSKDLKSEPGEERVNDVECTKVVSKHGSNDAISWISFSDANKRCAVTDSKAGKEDGIINEGGGSIEQAPTSKRGCDAIATHDAADSGPLGDNTSKATNEYETGNVAGDANDEVACKRGCNADAACTAADADKSISIKGFKPEKGDKTAIDGGDANEKTVNNLGGDASTSCNVADFEVSNISKSNESGNGDDGVVTEKGNSNERAVSRLGNDAMAAFNDAVATFNEAVAALHAAGSGTPNSSKAAESNEKLRVSGDDEAVPDGVETEGGFTRGDAAVSLQENEKGRALSKAFTGDNRKSNGTKMDVVDLTGDSNNDETAGKNDTKSCSESGSSQCWQPQTIFLPLFPTPSSHQSVVINIKNWIAETTSSDSLPSENKGSKFWFSKSIATSSQLCQFLNRQPCFAHLNPFRLITCKKSESNVESTGHVKFICSCSSRRPRNKSLAAKISKSLENKVKVTCPFHFEVCFDIRSKQFFLSRHSHHNWSHECGGTDAVVEKSEGRKRKRNVESENDAACNLGAAVATGASTRRKTQSAAAASAAYLGAHENMRGLEVQNELTTWQPMKMCLPLFTSLESKNPEIIDLIDWIDDAVGDDHLGTAEKNSQRLWLPKSIGKATAVKAFFNQQISNSARCRFVVRGKNHQGVVKIMCHRGIVPGNDLRLLTSENTCPFFLTINLDQRLERFYILKNSPHNWIHRGHASRCQEIMVKSVVAAGNGDRSTNKIAGVGGRAVWKPKRMCLPLFPSLTATKAVVVDLVEWIDNKDYAWPGAAKNAERLWFAKSITTPKEAKSFINQNGLKEDHRLVIKKSCMNKGMGYVRLICHRGVISKCDTKSESSRPRCKTNLCPFFLSISFDPGQKRFFFHKNSGHNWTHRGHTRSYNCSKAASFASSKGRKIENKNTAQSPYSNFKYTTRPKGTSANIFPADDEIGPGWKMYVLSGNSDVGPFEDRYFVSPDGKKWFRKIWRAKAYLLSVGSSSVDKKEKSRRNAIENTEQNVEVDSYSMNEVEELIEAITNDYHSQVEASEQSTDNRETEVELFDRLTHLIEEMKFEYGLENADITEDMILSRYCKRLDLHDVRRIRMEHNLKLLDCRKSRRK